MLVIDASAALHLWAKTYDAEYASLARMLCANLLSRDERL